MPFPVWVFAAVAVAGALVLNRTAYGRYVQAIGSNEQVARYAAVNVDRIKVITYMLLGVCVGVATLLYVPRLGSASPTTGLLWELEAIAAVIVGGTALKGGSGTRLGTVIGAVLLSVIGNILNLTSIISVYLNAAVQGFVIIAVAFLQQTQMNLCTDVGPRGATFHSQLTREETTMASLTRRLHDRRRRGGIRCPGRRSPPTLRSVSASPSQRRRTASRPRIVWWANKAKADLEKAAQGSQDHRQDGGQRAASRPTSSRTC